MEQLTIVQPNAQQLEALYAAQAEAFTTSSLAESFIESKRREKTEGGWGQDGRMQDWILVRRDDPGGDIVVGCHTSITISPSPNERAAVLTEASPVSSRYRRKLLVKRKGQSDIEDAWMYGVASVVTPPAHRGKGYATHFFRLLHYLLGDPADLPPFPTQWGEPPTLPDDVRLQIPLADTSILWSDIGSHFYEKCTVGESLPGWAVRDEENQELIWKILPPATPPQNGGVDEEEVGWEEIYESDLDEIRRELLRCAKAAMSKADSSTHTLLCPDPTNPGMLEFLPVRGRWRAPPSSPVHTRRFPCGLRQRRKIEPGIGDTIVLFTPYCEILGKRLLFTMKHNLVPSQLPSLLARLDGYAHELGHTEGVAWGLDPSIDLVKAWKGLSEREVVTKRRDEKQGRLLAVVQYKEHTAKLVDSQMWQWC